jgi:hypothetical protein
MFSFLTVMFIILTAFALSITFSKGHSSGTLASFMMHLNGMYKAVYGNFAFFEDNSA